MIAQYYLLHQIPASASEMTTQVLVAINIAQRVLAVDLRGIGIRADILIRSSDVTCRFLVQSKFVATRMLAVVPVGAVLPPRLGVDRRLDSDFAILKTFDHLQGLQPSSRGFQTVERRCGLEKRLKVLDERTRY